MDGLQFSPSGSVWSNIDKAIAGQRRRRRGVMVFLLPLLLLSGATGAYLCGQGIRNQHGNTGIKNAGHTGRDAIGQRPDPR